MGKAKGSARASHLEKRERRSFSAEFKLGAVQLMRSRRAQGVSLEQMALATFETRPSRVRPHSVRPH